jgi:predicted metal-dependent hydrolase
MAEAPFRNAPLLTPEQLQSRLSELYEAIDQFNMRWYFESHETLEDLWMVTPLPERTFMQGIIQLAAALVHYARGEQPGVLKLLDASADKLREFAPRFLGVETARLLDDIARVRAEFVELGEERVREWDERRLPQIGYERDGLNSGS